MTRLKELSLSPYHHKHADVRRLIQLFDQQYPSFDQSFLDRQQLFQRLYPGQAHDQNRLAVLFTYALKLTEDFLVLEELAKEEATQQHWLLRSLRERRQYDHYERKLKKEKAKLESSKIQDAQFYASRSQLADEADLYFVQIGKRRDDPNLQEKEYFLDHYYLYEKLKNAVELMVRRQILKVDYSARLAEAVLQEVSQNQEAYANTPAILVYYRLYLLMRDSKASNYHLALQTFQNHEGVFSRDEVVSLYNYFQNFCIARINRNESGYLRELFELYRDQLQRDLLYEDDKMVEWNYKNIVTVAIRLGELDWTKNFILEYRHKLDPKAADNAYRFNMAVYSHAAKDYPAVLELLTQVEYVDLRYNLGAKALLLRTYYELGEFETLNALVDSFRQYLQRNRLMADSRRAGYYQLFRLTRRAAAIQSQIDYNSQASSQRSLKKLREDIAATGAIFNRAWLEEKVTLLEKSVKK